MVDTRIVPNFFFVGAPKCGTTALREYLHAHPNVFMSTPKEPYYFADDLFSRHIRKYIGISSLEDYINLFASCTAEHKVAGEASVWYLYSKTAIRNIYNYNEDAKIIVMIRNPVDLVYSLHSQQLYNFQEDEPDFSRAWQLQEKRKQGCLIPRKCLAQALLQYRDVGRLGDQIERLYSVVPAEQVKIILFDDFVVNSLSVYKDVLSFLQLSYDGRTEFQKINVNKGHKIEWLGEFLQQPPRPLRFGWKKLEKVFGHQISRPIHLLRNMNSTSTGRQPLKARFRAQLVEEFRDDVKKLSKILERNLDHWR